MCPSDPVICSVWADESVKGDGCTWTRYSHHGFGSTANITTCADVRGGGEGGEGKGRVREREGGEEEEWELSVCRVCYWLTLRLSLKQRDKR